MFQEDDAIQEFIDTVGGQFMSLLFKYLRNQLSRGSDQGGQRIFTSTLLSEDQISASVLSFTREAHPDSSDALTNVLRLILPSILP